jgi:hypothetical protein
MITLTAITRIMPKSGSDCQHFNAAHGRHESPSDGGTAKGGLFAALDVREVGRPAAARTWIAAEGLSLIRRVPSHVPVQHLPVGEPGDRPQADVRVRADEAVVLGDVGRTLVVLTNQGRTAIEQAAPAHVDTVRRLVFNGLPGEQVSPCRLSPSPSWARWNLRRLRHG